MDTIWSEKKLLFWKALIFCSLFFAGFICIILISISTLFESREISYSSYLPRSATDVNEKTEYFQPGPDEEYRYFLKAKITEDEFLEFANVMKLEWASPINRSGIPARKSNLPWWNPPGGYFIYAKGNGVDYSVQADYVYTTGYLYMYIEQN